MYRVLLITSFLQRSQCFFLCRFGADTFTLPGMFLLMSISWKRQRNFTSHFFLSIVNITYNILYTIFYLTYQQLFKTLLVIYINSGP